VSAVHLDDALGYRKPEAGATFFLGYRIVCLLKFLKQLLLVCVGYARAGIAYRYRKVPLPLDARMAISP
jgi:hypothetical protein